MKKSPDRGGSPAGDVRRSIACAAIASACRQCHAAPWRGELFVQIAEDHVALVRRTAARVRSSHSATPEVWRQLAVSQAATLIGSSRPFHRRISASRECLQRAHGGGVTVK